MSAQCPFRYPRLYFTAASGEAWVNRKKALSQGRRGGGGRQCLGRCAVLRAMQQRLRPPKGPGELATPVLCLRCVAPAAASACRLSLPEASGRRHGRPKLKLLSARQKPLVLRGTARDAATAAAAKGTRGACDACPMPALRGPRGSKWNRALPGPLPLQTRSRGCVLREIRFNQASFW